MGCFWLWFAVSPIATEPSFLCSYISSLFPWSAVRHKIPPAFSIAALRLFLCQQLFKSSLTFLLTFIVITLYFKCRLGDIKPYTIGRCRDLKPATMPTLILKSAYFFMHNQTPTFKQNVLSAICNGAQVYKDIFIDFEYQVFSKFYQIMLWGVGS